MKKKIVAIVVACVLAISVGGYFVYRYVLPNKEFSLEFSEYYQQAEDFEELEPLLNQYFGMVQAAYDRSDKQNLETFVLDDSFEEVAKILTDKRDAHSDTLGLSFYLSDDEQESYYAALDLYYHFSTLHLLILEKNALLVANNYHAPNPEWFNEFSDTFSEIYTEYALGNGES